MDDQIPEMEDRVEDIDERTELIAPVMNDLIAFQMLLATPDMADHIDDQIEAIADKVFDMIPDTVCHVRCG